ncbi:MAG: host attachment protein [Burkholderiales bacterium]
MSTTWILIANASQARLFINEGPNKGLKLLKELFHPESREKASDLVSDRPGHYKSGGNGNGAYVPPTDPKEHEAETFALELAKELEHGRTGNRFQRLIVAATPAFLGKINNSLSHHVSGLVSNTLQKDYTKANEKELAAHLEKLIYL